MCIFSGPADVANTRIFASPSPRAGGRHQYVLYQMEAASQQDFAMILPLPVPPGSAESTVHFLNLEYWPRIFDHLNDLFPWEFYRDPLRWLLAPFMKSASLSVVEVGDYVASYVPSLKDFDRLDPCFRLPEATWTQLPDYGDYGFAVFQLQAGRHQTHPMAFEFPRRDSSQLFFPTVHVHDGHVHSEAGFDHSLYCQVTPRPRGWKAGFWKPYSHPSIWEISEEERAFLNLNGTVYRLRLKGVLANRDTLLTCR